MPLIEEPLRVGPLALGSRLVLPPMATHKVGRDGFANEAMAAHYGELAKRAFGLIETEHHYVSADGRAGQRQASAAREDDVPALALVADAVHAAGKPVLLQLNHAGAATTSAVIATTPLAPSEVALRSGDETPRAMDGDDITRVVADFAAAAHRAMAAGYDGVEIHAAHGYLLDEFYSPLTNLRTDAYGGSPGCRAQLLVEVTAAVREATGPGAVVSLRLGACDYAEGGATAEDAVVAARAVANAGADLISVSGGLCGFTRPGHQEPGWFADAATAIRAAVDVPVLLTGGVRSAEDAEALLESGACDLVGIGRHARAV